MTDHDPLHGRGRMVFIVASVTFSIAVTMALGFPAAEASSRQSAKTIFAAARARLINESQLAGHWTASSYGAGSSGGGSGSSGGGSGSSGGSGNSIAVSQCSNVSEPGVDQNPYFVEGDYFDRKGTNAEIQEEIDVYPKF